MSSNQYLRVGDQVRLSNDHSWSRDATNPTNARGYVEHVPRGEGSINVRWALPESTRTNTYNSRHSDLILLPATVNADDVETRERFMQYCDAREISLRVEDYGDNKVTLTPMDDEQII